jgi:hypothetical protein
MELNGKIIVIGNTETVGSAGTFKKRQLVIETSEQYPQKVSIDFVQDKTSLLDNYAIGNDVNVDINIRGNEYNGKYYVSLNGWKIAKNDNSAPVQSEPFEMISDVKDSSDDMPF